MGRTSAVRPPLSIRETSRRSPTIPMSRSAEAAASAMQDASDGEMPGSSRATSSIHLMPDSGVRSWCAANETKSDFIRLISRSRVTSWIVIVKPCSSPSSVGCPIQCTMRWPSASSRSPSRIVGDGPKRPSSVATAPSVVVAPARSTSSSSMRPIARSGSTPSSSPARRLALTMTPPRSTSTMPSEVESKICPSRACWRRDSA